MPQSPVEAVSVALCTYNGGVFIADQVRSILTQSVPVAELVVSDDASKDDTIAQVEALVAAATPRPTLRVLRNEEALGVTRNFAQALNACAHDVILLSDQDDRWLPGRVELALAALSSSDAPDLVATDALLVDGDGHSLGATLAGRLGISRSERSRLAGSRPWAPLMRRNLITGATVGVRRSLLERATPFPPNWLHDEWLAMIAAATGSLVLSPTASIEYRQHSLNVVGVHKRTLSTRLERLTVPGARRNARLLARAEELVAHLEHLGNIVDPRALKAARGKLEYERRRSALPLSRRRRLWPILKVASRGSYRRYGLGAQDILRDLVQPM